MVIVRGDSTHNLSSFSNLRTWELDLIRPPLTSPLTYHSSDTCPSLYHTTIPEPSSDILCECTVSLMQKAIQIICLILFNCMSFSIAKFSPVYHLFPDRASTDKSQDNANLILDENFLVKKAMPKVPSHSSPTPHLIQLSRVQTA
jgi:hypothetical protein